MLETALTIFGIALQTLGLVAAATGLYKTFKDCSAPGDRFFSSVLATEFEVARQVRTALVRSIRRFLRRPRPSVTHGLGTALSAGFTGRAKGLVQFGQLPDPAQDAEAFRAEIENRLNRLFKLAQDVQHDLGQEAKARGQEAQRLEEDLQARIATIDHESKRATIRGLREQVLGFFCVALGLVVQSVLDLTF
ncbi:hypothetical protein [Streptomyces sp. NBC_00620]|uniref:hypothetical protein n=1 Tax=Streptomyces sp. NBC_00620 TaxID=2903666 RepID=UPI002258105E|nr:hypothetical protein [Streptomyces sp. NBC_00620]MCX4973188.1 hypothetical protein [Streptomyces sp. NBC_00620]